MLNIFAAILALGVELAMLWAYGAWAFQLPIGLLARVAATVGLVLLVVSIWGIFLAPRALIRPPVVLRAIAKVLVFAGGSACGWVAGEHVFAITIAILGAVSLSLEFAAGIGTTGLAAG